MTTANGTRRLFIACRIRDPIIEQELADTWDQVVQLLPGDADPQREPNIHITLRFLGDVDPGEDETGTSVEVEALNNLLSIQAKRIDQIPLTLSYLHTFPGVVWASVGGTEEAIDELNLLHKRVDHAVAALGWPEADYDFLPHVTVGRFDKEASPLLSRALASADYPKQVQFTLETVELLESVRIEADNPADRVQYRLVGEEHRLNVHTP